MKILHANRSYSGGGVEEYLKQLFAVLHKEGHRNAFLLGQNLSDGQALPHVHTIGIDKITDIDRTNRSLNLDKVEKVVDELNPDLVFIHQVLNSDLIEKLTEMRPSVRFVHDYKLICPDGEKVLKNCQKVCHHSIGYNCQLNAYRFRCMPRNFSIGMPLISRLKKILRIHKKRSQIVVASSFMKTALIKNGFKRERIWKIPYFTNLPQKKEDYPQSGSSTILSIGRIAKAKGMHRLLSALRNVKKNTELAIVGDGPELMELKKLANRLGLTSRVKFHGWIPHQKLETIFSNCAMLVVPSIWPEPFGIVGIEAMAHARPVVAFNVGGISDWLQNDDSGILIKPQDEVELAKKINFLLDNPNLSAQMGRKGRALVEKKYLPQHHVDELIKVFEKAIQFNEKY